METYKDMLEKLKYHKQLIMNAFIRNNYFPSNEEVQATLKVVNARLSLFESYISKPGSLFNATEINYCFEMIYKDLAILYKVLEDILTHEYSQLKLHIESTLTELEAKAEHFYKKCYEEANSSALGTTIVFQANNWNISTADQVAIINLGEYDFIEGSKIACFAHINDIDKDSVVFKFTANDPSKSFLALPFNLYDDIYYRIPGTLSVNKKEVQIGEYLIINDYIELDYETDPVNDYVMTGGKGFMSVTYKSTGRTELVKFPDMEDYYFFAAQDCFIEFYLVDGNINEHSSLEYSFNMAPNHCNFSLQNGTIKIDKDIKRIYIDAQAGLTVGFRREGGEAYAECIDAIIVNNNSVVYNGNTKIRDLVLREYVKTNLINYKVQVYIDSKDDIIDKIDSICIKEID